MSSTVGGPLRRLPVNTTTDHVTNTNPRDPLTTSRNDFGFETDISYKNGLPYPITVILRNGLSLTIPPLSGNWRDQSNFVVQVRYRFAKNVKIDIHRILDAVDADSSNELIALKDAVRDARVNQTANSNECVLSYQVTRAQFEALSDGMYLSNLDITISKDILGGDSYVVHPESPAGQALQHERRLATSSFKLDIEINDPEQLFGDRFVNVLGRIYRVHARIHPDRPAGVYLTSPNDIDQDVCDAKHYPFESADAELMLFRTASEARTLGNLAETRKAEFEEIRHNNSITLANLELNFKQQLHDLNLQLNQHKTDKLQREGAHAEEVARLKAIELRLSLEASEREAKQKSIDAAYAAEKADREARAYRERDYYERRSYDRKDSSEIVKWIPPMVVGAGLIIAKFL
jgi:hypothetical protein